VDLAGNAEYDLYVGSREVLMEEDDPIVDIVPKNIPSLLGL
jgi:hypothetical protein